jgi:DnaJ domain
MLYKNTDVFMKMTVDEALIILGIKDRPVTKEVIKRSYRRMASKYHPDKNIGNPDATKDAMQRINVARDFLDGNVDDLRLTSRSSVVNLAGITVVKGDGKTVVYGKTYPLKQVFKRHGFKWSPEENVWWCYGAYPIEKHLCSA